MFTKIASTYNPYGTYIYCELVKKTLDQIKLTNKRNEIKETEDEQSE